jgi:hypothetical protein
MGSGQFDKAAILSHDCSGVEASSPGFTVCHPFGLISTVIGIPNTY